MTDFDRAYRENAELVYRYVFSLTRNADLAEEVTQQTFYEAIRHPGNYRGEAALSTYLCGDRRKPDEKGAFPPGQGESRSHRGNDGTCRGRAAPRMRQWGI